ncbi:TetR/AcrR family transcriptional regulator [Bradyrhizobium septentrionale]|uniref:TetR/AcrR family transcriptional regulator n=1 Tax=Bradyrhizobium septentrionale TaxID=1404411 RepID=A0A973W8D0_9BRAD|nr:TetR/AcrR family transcriptional regulator [Bradyrhizobium septentrionale]UGY17692.1 TetR/AcrR family transcriptional regulator [Bradyrhizobium septentrionale]UGY26429.1 TetR/AcrR family transcriptional regulator [Bradyrhizobium septentrionale]
MASNRPRKTLRPIGATPARAKRQIRPGGRSARVRASVLQAAFAVLTQKGYDDFTIADVAARASVHETSIYRRWGTRTALAVDACLHFAEAALPIPDTGSLRSDLVGLVRSLADMLTSPQGRAMLALTVARDPNSVAARRAYWRQRFDLARAIFDRAVSRGEFPRQANPIVFLETLIAPLYFRLLVSDEPIEEWPTNEMIDHLLRPFQVSAVARKSR